MKIIRCQKCGSYLYKTDKCYRCGNSSGFDNISQKQVHDNISDEYVLLEELINHKKYEEALKVSYQITEWEPALAEAYWIRVLVKNQCSSELDIICKGISCEEDADFYNSISFANDIEHGIYQDVQKYVEAMRAALQSAVIEKKYSAIKKTDITQLQNLLSNEIVNRKRSIYSNWTALQKTEQALFSREADFRLLTKEYQVALNSSTNAVFSIKKEADRASQCTLENKRKTQVRLRSYLQESELAKNTIERMKKEHPWVKEYEEMLALRNQQVQSLKQEVKSLKQYDNKILQTLSNIEMIEKRHDRVISGIATYDFLKALDILSVEEFNTVLHSCGISVDLPSKMTKEKDNKTIKEMDANDLLTAWGID